MRPSVKNNSGSTWFRRGLQSIKGIPRTRYLVNQWECNNC